MYNWPKCNNINGFASYLWQFKGNNFWIPISPLNTPLKFQISNSWKPSKEVQQDSWQGIKEPQAAPARWSLTMYGNLYQRRASYWLWCTTTSHAELLTFKRSEGQYPPSYIFSQQNLHLRQHGSSVVSVLDWCYRFQVRSPLTGSKFSVSDHALSLTTS